MTRRATFIVSFTVKQKAHKLLAIGLSLAKPVRAFANCRGLSPGHCQSCHRWARAPRSKGRDNGRDLGLGLADGSARQHVRVDRMGTVHFIDRTTSDHDQRCSTASVMALGLAGPPSSGTLESTVLAMLSSARAATQLKTTSATSRSRTKPPSAKSKPPQAFSGPGTGMLPEGIDPAKLATLQSYGRKLNEGLHEQGWMQVKTMRFPPKGENIDRKFVVESSLDPMDNSAVILRVRPATAAELPEPGPKYLTTEQAAKVLNVSRPYVIGLVDAGTLKDVMRTGANHRRIPESELLRMRELMHTQMSKGIEEIEELNSDLPQRELDEASRWVVNAVRGTKKPAPAKVAKAGTGARSAAAAPPLVTRGVPPVVFLDANILIPEYLRSIFLELSEAGFLQANWSEVFDDNYLQDGRSRQQPSTCTDISIAIDDPRDRDATKSAEIRRCCSLRCARKRHRRNRRRR